LWQLAILGPKEIPKEIGQFCFSQTLRAVCGFRDELRVFPNKVGLNKDMDNDAGICFDAAAASPFFLLLFITETTSFCAAATTHRREVGHEWPSLEHIYCIIAMFLRGLSFIK
jgi:hypothetical protein